MMLVILIYLSDLVTSLSVLCFLTCCLTGLVGGILYGASYVADIEARSEDKQLEWDVLKMRRIGKRFLIGFFTCVVLLVITPSQKTLYTIAGVYYAPKVVETVKDNALFNKSIKLLEKKIDKALSEE